MTSRSTTIAVLVAAALGVAAPGCGGGDRQDVDQGNEGQLDPRGSESTTPEPNTGITPTTTEPQPSVTQGEGG